MDFGRKQVQRRAHGFKADFFSAMADSMTTECVFLGGQLVSNAASSHQCYLDGAAHSVSQLVALFLKLLFNLAIYPFRLLRLLKHGQNSRM